MTTDSRLVTMLKHCTEQVQELERLPMTPRLRKFVHEALLALVSAVAYASTDTISTGVDDVST